MYYASIDIIAFIIHLIINFDILNPRNSKRLSQVQKAYKSFLNCVTLYYITDAIWEAFYALDYHILIYLDTEIYFIVVALTVLLWTQYAITYLNEKTSFTAFLRASGWIFVFLQILILIINIFKPIAFWFDAGGVYQTGIARKINFLFQFIMFITAAIHIFIKTKNNDKKLKHRYYVTGIFSLVMAIFVVLQSLFPLLPFYAVGYMFGTCLIHTFVLNDEKDARRVELERLLQLEQIQKVEIDSTRKLAFTDSLTGVKNNMAYIEEITAIEHRIENNISEEFSIAVFDINDLKKINDSKGHDAGNLYIKAACTLICNAFKHSPVYRIGGDEFVAILKGEDYKNRTTIINQFNNQIDENLSGNQVVIACGHSDFRKDSDKSYLRIFERADKQMYNRKKKLKAHISSAL